MAHQPRWDPQYARPEQGADFQLGLFGEPFVSPYPNVPPGPRPTPAPENVLATGYGGPVSHGYPAGAIESAPFITSSAFGSAHPAVFPMQPNPTLDNTWNPPGSNPPPPPSQFYGYGGSTWTPPTAWHVSNLSSLLGSHPLVADQAGVFGQRPPVLRSSPGFRSAVNPTATHPGQAFGMASNTTPEAPQQPHLQAPGRSIPGPRSFFWRQLQHLTGSTSQDIEACWPCKCSHKKCSPGTPCHRCATSPGNSAIPCCRGQVCDVTAEIPFLCHLPRGAARLEVLPLELHPAANLLSQASQRQRQTISRIKHHEHVAGSDMRNHSIFYRVVNTEVPNIRGFQHFGDLQLLNFIELPYDDLIVRIVWELEDNPEAAQLTGVGAVEDLVTLLEAACLCEAESGGQNKNRRLVYSSMFCLLYCMQALRLSAHNLLAAKAHAYCTQADECISPAFHGLTRYALRYAEALTMALFHKNKGKHDQWLLVFYSLCVQGYVRRALMSLEERLQSVELSAGGMEVVGRSRPLSSANYLQTAVSLFRGISMQNRGKLAKKIRNSRPKPSVYLQQPPHPSRSGSSSSSSNSSSWQKWREEDYLGRIFQIPINDSTIHYRPHHTESSSTSTDSDSDVTITSPPPAAVTATVTARVATTQVGGAVSNANGDCMTPGSTPAPSIIDSTWSETSYGGNSDAWTFDAGSVTPSSASFVGSLTSSMLSLSTVTREDNTSEDDNTFKPDMGL